MNTVYIKKANIKPLLKEAVGDWHVYAPLEETGGDVNFSLLDRDKIDEALDKVTLEDKATAIGPKDLFFPQLESLFEIKKIAFGDKLLRFSQWYPLDTFLYHKKGKIKETVEYSKKLVFGIKACDLKGMQFTEGFFKQNFEDKYYLSRAKDRFVVVKGCLEPPRPEACFCTSAKTGPFLDEGYDIQLVDIGEAYFVELGSRQAEDFIARYKKFFHQASSSDKDRISQVKQKAFDAVNCKIDFSRALRLITQEVPERLYKKIAQRCIHCGGCIYACPTCTCFNVFDDLGKGVTRRFRNWDACVFSGFSREASGFNPRPTKWLRASRRYEHKLRYDYEQTGKSSCVGCGRCLVACPVNLGMSQFIQELTA